MDIYRGVSKPAKDYRLYMLYVFFFPKLLAGPIIKYHDIANQLEECRHAGLDDVILGFTRFMLGVIKKFLLPIQWRKAQILFFLVIQAF